MRPRGRHERRLCGRPRRPAGRCSRPPPTRRRLPASVEKLYTTSTALLRFGPNATWSPASAASARSTPAAAGTARCTCAAAAIPTFGSRRYDSYAYGTGATMQRLVANLVAPTGITLGPRRDRRRRVLLRLPARHAGHRLPRLDRYVEGDAQRPRPTTAASPTRRARRSRPGRRCSRPSSSSARSARPRQGALGHPRLHRAHAPAARPDRSPPCTRRGWRTLIHLTNTPSDNFFAEMLLKDIGAPLRRPTARPPPARPSSAASSPRSFGIHPALDDGSGLSRDDRTSPREVVTAAEGPGRQRRLRQLPVGRRRVAGRWQTGLRGTAAQGRCRGKTGTLHDVANLVGYCTARDGHRSCSRSC